MFQCDEVVVIAVVVVAVVMGRSELKRSAAPGVESVVIKTRGVLRGHYESWRANTLRVLADVLIRT